MTDKDPQNLEQRIRSLCHLVLKTLDEEELLAMCAELRTLLSEHMELARTKLSELKLKELQVKKELQ